ncbi:MAG: GNAT family N-acetyltransferase [Planctomycetota bacterium]|nr:GNAT family N-acetyltransferase [Planctomycetota bacterium]
MNASQGERRAAATEKLPQLFMLRPALDGLPALDLPAGCTLRTFRKGDQGAWNAMMDAAFERKPGTTDFEKAMRADPEFRPERVQIIERAGEVVATASAWFNARYGPHAGYVHWVGTHPAHRGLKLGHWASVAALQHMKREGRRVAVLHTDDFRLAALKIYLALGFGPCVHHESHRARWPKVLAALSWPERFEPALNGDLVTFPLA